MSISASGTVGNSLLYQKNKAGKYVREYNKPSGAPSGSQGLIREYNKEAVEKWQALTDEEKQEWGDFVK